MERQKQVKTNALTKVEAFLREVYFKIGKGDSFSLDALAREHRLSGSLATVCKRLKIVDKIGKGKESGWVWVWPVQPERSLAVTLMDEVNRANGNFKLLDKALAQDQGPRGLFDPVASVSERVYIAGCIASAVYTNELLFGKPEGWSIELNQRIIFATQDLLTNLYKPKTLKENE